MNVTCPGQYFKTVPWMQVSRKSAATTLYACILLSCKRCHHNCCFFQLFCLIPFLWAGAVVPISVLQSFLFRAVPNDNCFSQSNNPMTSHKDRRQSLICVTLSPRTATHKLTLISSTGFTLHFCSLVRCWHNCPYTDEHMGLLVGFPASSLTRA